MPDGALPGEFVLVEAGLVVARAGDRVHLLLDTKSGYERRSLVGDRAHIPGSGAAVHDAEHVARSETLIVLDEPDPRGDNEGAVLLCAKRIPGRIADDAPVGTLDLLPQTLERHLDAEEPAVDSPATPGSCPTRPAPSES